MAATLKELLMAYDNGALSIKYEKGHPFAELGGIKITEQQAAQLCTNNFGWIEYRLHPFEIIEKTQKFMRSVKSNLKDPNFWEYGTVQFQNKRDTDYGRTFDRIVIACGNLSYTILYNMKSAGGTYVLYRTGDATPVKKLRNLKQVVQFIESRE